MDPLLCNISTIMIFYLFQNVSSARRWANAQSSRRSRARARNGNNREEAVSPDVSWRVLSLYIGSIDMGLIISTRAYNSFFLRARARGTRATRVLGEGFSAAG